eukprot:scaffold803_cov310-Pinguiococcus_pyrenoidosus.AAC.7
MRRLDSGLRRRVAPPPRWRALRNTRATPCASRLPPLLQLLTPPPHPSLPRRLGKTPLLAERRTPRPSSPAPLLASALALRPAWAPTWAPTVAPAWAPTLPAAWAPHPSASPSLSLAARHCGAAPIEIGRDTSTPHDWPAPHSRSHPPPPRGSPPQPLRVASRGVSAPTSRYRRPTCPRTSSGRPRKPPRSAPAAPRRCAAAARSGIPARCTSESSGCGPPADGSRSGCWQ